MILLKNYNGIDEINEFSDYILNWYNSNRKLLNVVSVPYNTCEFFIKTILECILFGNNVLYITNENENNINIINHIKKSTTFRQYSYIRSSDLNISSKFKIANFKVANNLKEKFDLVIYDDISSFSNYNNKEIKEIIELRLKKSGKGIIYSIESLFKFNRTIYIPLRWNKIPMIEPRIMLTRINLNKDMPFIIYDYIQWSIQSKRKILIYTPFYDLSENLYSYLNNYNKKINVNIILDNDHKSSKTINNFIKMKKGIIITNYYRNDFCRFKDTDLIVYSADREDFHYKKLTYLCSTVGRGEYDFRGEVIFLANTETKDMEKARNITVNFNKEAWKMGLLSI
ncbi:competence protein ComF [Clostridium niameyense]|uniref:Competence protein ComF n=1 Tax=Clostridium niameyense TaxID=1622073 RepID=A0A6M0RBW2_9CLOT|nr:competence protein ComF [Clostridium niameyense]NEZ47059.1 competence protein ComF [Clostridium niameyense]